MQTSTLKKKSIIIRWGIWEMEKIVWSQHKDEKLDLINLIKPSVSAVIPELCTRNYGKIPWPHGRWSTSHFGDLIGAWLAQVLKTWEYSCDKPFLRSTSCFKCMIWNWQHTEHHHVLYHPTTPVTVTILFSIVRTGAHNACFDAGSAIRRPT